MHSTGETLPEKQGHGGPRTCSPAWRRDTSPGRGSQHGHASPSTFPQTRVRAERKNASTAPLLFPPHAVWQTPSQSPQSSPNCKKNHEAEQGRTGTEDTHKNIKQLLGRMGVWFSNRNVWGFLIYFWVIIFKCISCSKILSSYLELSGIPIFILFSHKQDKL